MEITRDRLIALVSVVVSALIFTMAIIASLQQNNSVFEPKPCANAQTEYSNFYVSACPEFRGNHCKLKAGISINIKVDFITPKPFKEAVALTKIGKTVDLFFLPTAGGHCPAKKGDPQHLSWNVMVPKNAASNEWIDLMVGVRLSTEDEFLFCYTLPAKIYEP